MYLLVFIVRGLIFDGVGGGEIVCHFALYLSFSVFPMFA